MFKRKVVIKNKRYKSLNLDCETIILFTLFLCGIILGAFLIKNCDERCLQRWLEN